MIFKLCGALVVSLIFCVGFPRACAAQESDVPSGIQAGACCGKLSAEGEHILQLLNQSRVEELWLSGRHIDWETGEPDRPIGYVGPETKTHCSAYVAAMAKRLGVYVLRPPQHAQELLANAQTAWFGSAQGAASGWYEVRTPREAQSLANAGKLVVASFQAANPHRPGHIGIVRPDARRTLNEIRTDGVWMTQAGETNYLRVSERVAFAHHPGAWPDGVRYFAHDL